MKKVQFLIVLFTLLSIGLFGQNYTSQLSGNWIDNIWNNNYISLPLTFPQNQNNIVITIKNNHTITLSNNVIINGNGLQIIIEPGGQFIIDENGSIDLRGNNANLNIDGNLQVDGNINFDKNGGSVTGNGSITGDGSITGNYDQSESINNILPIELLSFTSKVKENSIELEWVTASEINNDYFIIEKSKDLVNWGIVSFIQGAGNSNHIIKYTIEDFNPIKGISYYRLTQHDFDGQFEVFNPISVVFEELFNNYRYNKINIYDFMGNKIETLLGENIYLKNYNKPIIVVYLLNDEIIKTKKILRK